MVVTAEGIETEEQMAFVKAHNCDEGQGYLISMPRLAADLGPFLQDAEPALKLAS